MLAELAIANAAFKVIKTTIQNGMEFVEAGESLGKFFSAEREVKKKLEAGSLSVEDAFKAKRDLEKAEAFLRETLNTERVEGYRIWLDFKNDYLREQKAAEKIAARKKYLRRKAWGENLAIFTKVMATLALIIGAVVGVYIYLKP
jgi:hypothetical protein